MAFFFKIKKQNFQFKSQKRTFFISNFPCGKFFSRHEVAKFIKNFQKIPIYP
jgi:hypothetical protein